MRIAINIIIVLILMGCSPFTYYKKAEFAHNLSNDKKTQCYLNKLLQLDHNDYYYLKAKALQYTLNDIQDSAIYTYEQLIEIDPNDYDNWFKNGTSNLEIMNYGRALECFEEYIKLVKDNGLAYKNRGLCYMNISLYQEAVNDFYMYLKLEQDSTIYSKIASSYFADYDYENALKAYNIVIDRKAHKGCVATENLYWNRGVCNFNVGNAKDAIADYERALEMSDSYEIYKDLADAYLLSGDSINACVNIQKAYEYNVVDSSAISNYCK